MRIEQLIFALLCTDNFHSAGASAEHIYGTGHHYEPGMWNGRAGGNGGQRLLGQHLRTGGLTCRERRELHPMGPITELQRSRSVCTRENQVVFVLWKSCWPEWPIYPTIWFHQIQGPS